MNKLDKILNEKERRIFRKLNTPGKVQDFLEKLPFNFEKDVEKRGKEYLSPREVLKAGRAHCFEGAIFAAAALYFQGRPALILDLKVSDVKKDTDHAVALFR